MAAKRRSVHNSYMTFPVLFIMLSNHYSMTYGHPQNWLILLLMIVGGAAIRHVMIGKTAAKNWAALPAAAAIAAVVVMTGPALRPKTTMIADSGEPVAYMHVHQIIQQRCLQCHSPNPTDDVFKAAPNGVMLDAPEKVRALAEKIRFRVVETKTMPMANKTGITEEERALLGRWIAQGAKIQ